MIPDRIVALLSKEEQKFLEQLIKVAKSKKVTIEFDGNEVVYIKEGKGEIDRNPLSYYRNLIESVEVEEA